MKHNIILDLENLDDTDLQEVLDLIHTKANPQEVEKVARKKGGGRKQSRRKKNLDEAPEEDIIERPRARKKSQQPRRKKGGRKGGKRRGRQEEFDIHKHRRQRSRGRQNKQGTPAHTESVDISGEDRPNEFITKGFHKLHRQDVEVDKKLRGKNQLTERREEVEYIEVDCSRCGDTWEVLPSQTYRDDKGLSFVCETCVNRTR